VKLRKRGHELKPKDGGMPLSTSTLDGSRSASRVRVGSKDDRVAGPLEVAREGKFDREEKFETERL
jgi:hypothetical protein